MIDRSGDVDVVKRSSTAAVQRATNGERLSLSLIMWARLFVALFYNGAVARARDWVFTFYLRRTCSVCEEG